jgi:predicted nucleic acid-binding protein
MLVDTSVWVDHLCRRNSTLVSLLESGEVLTHPFVIGELASGHLAQRAKVLSASGELPFVPSASHAEVLDFFGTRKLMGRGLGWIDLHLLASPIIAKVPLWSADKRLSAVAREMGVLTHS